MRRGDRAAGGERGHAFSRGAGHHRHCPHEARRRRARRRGALDARGHQTPIKFAGVGGKLDQFEPVYPDRLAGRNPRHGRRGGSG